ncbi:hypothetical protein KSX_22770 [Ktedonospora formicarum]|uniref:Uncharacterized protein n=1 Tax=Ktedonospora formicarum TaxID=2778364 RepID=A0A8J3HUQ5_9CHLR|nr:hypothetical protein KSX_22770 [Ktedonospora formicarum]
MVSDQLLYMHAVRAGLIPERKSYIRRRIAMKVKTALRITTINTARAAINITGVIDIIGLPLSKYRLDSLYLNISAL